MDRQERPLNCRTSGGRLSGLKQALRNPATVASLHELDRLYRQRHPHRRGLVDQGAPEEYTRYRKALWAAAALFGQLGVPDVRAAWRGMACLGRLAEFSRTHPSSPLIDQAVARLGSFGHTGHTATGAHRAAPVVLAMANHIAGKNLFSPSPLARLCACNPAFRHLERNNPLYFSAERAAQMRDFVRAALGPGLPAEEVLRPRLPELTLGGPRVPPGGELRVLSVGCAPGEQGANELLLASCLAQLPWFRTRLLARGTDVFFPAFRPCSAGGAAPSAYDFTDGDRAVVGGAEYHRARRDDGRFAETGLPGDVTSPSFGLRDNDYVTVIMALHALKGKHEDYALRELLGEAVVRDENGTLLSPAERTFCMTPTQVAAVERLAAALREGGILFLNESSARFSAGKVADYDQRNDDLVLVLQRTAPREFVLPRAAIPFSPSERPPSSVPFLALKNAYSPHDYETRERKWGRVNLDEAYRGLRPHRLRAAFDAWAEGRPPEPGPESALVALLVWADALVFRSQVRDRSMQKQIRRACDLLALRPPLRRLFETYLDGVPDGDPERFLILQGAEAARIVPRD